MKYLPFILLLLWITGCEVYEPDEYRELVVIQAFAIANQPLPPVRVTRTIPADSVYNYSDVGLRNAIIRVSLLSENGEVEEVIPYKTTSSANGRYNPDDIHYLLPGRTYRLDVEFTDRPEEIQAYTTVPEAISIQNDVQDTVIYQSEEQLELVLSSSERNKEKQNVYVLNSISQNQEYNNLTPYYKNRVDEGDTEIDELFNHSTELLNEGNFEPAGNGSMLIRLPWIGVAFFGQNTVVANSLDQNLADFVRSREVQLGGSTLPPGEIPNLRYHVDGGIGIFGSLSSDTVVTYIKRP